MQTYGVGVAVYNHEGVIASRRLLTVLTFTRPGGS